MKTRRMPRGSSTLLAALFVNSLCACDGGRVGGAGGAMTTAGAPGGAGGTGDTGGTGGAGGSAAAHWTLESASSGGPGCSDPASVGVVVEEGGASGVSFSYATMKLSHPPGSTIQQTICVVGLSMHIEPGWRVTVARVGVQGSWNVPAAAKARQTTALFFAGQPLGTNLTGYMSGPSSGTYHWVDVIPWTSRVWSPCGVGAILGINAMLALHTPAGSAEPAGVDLTSMDLQIFAEECQ